MPTLIRTATAADVPGIVSILIDTKHAVFPDRLSVHDGNVEFWTARWQRYITEGATAQESLGGSFTFVAEQAGRPIGFAAFHFTRRHGVEAELQSIYVLPAAHGHGVGTRLLQTVAAELLRHDRRSMCVGYDPANPFKRFYFKHGAVEIDPHWAKWEDVSQICATMRKK